jgi:hypothetical protein
MIARINRTEMTDSDLLGFLSRGEPHPSGSVEVQVFLAGGRASSLRRYWRGLPMQPRQSVRRLMPRHQPPQGARPAAVRDR